MFINTGAYVTNNGVYVKEKWNIYINKGAYVNSNCLRIYIDKGAH